MWRSVRTYRGRYFFADFVAGRIFSTSLFPVGGGEVGATPPIEHTAELGGSGAIGNVSAFGVDAAGELYVVSYSSGTIFKMVDSQPLRADAERPTSMETTSPTLPCGVRRRVSGMWSRVRAASSSAQQWGAGSARTTIAGAWRLRRRRQDGHRGLAARHRRLVCGAEFGRRVHHHAVGRGSAITSRCLATTTAIPRPTSRCGSPVPAYGMWSGARTAPSSARSGAQATRPYNDVPVPGDYDGDRNDGHRGLAGADGIWYVIRSWTAPCQPPVGRGLRAL